MFLTVRVLIYPLLVSHRNNIDEERMTRCLIQELTSLLSLSGIKTVTSMYFGGGKKPTFETTLLIAIFQYQCTAGYEMYLFLCIGTPSLAKPDTVEAVISSVEEKSMLASGAEITLEANPTSAQTNKLRWQVNENVG